MNTARFMGAAVAVIIAIQAPFVRATPDVWRRSYALEAQGNARAALEAMDTLPTTERQGYLFSLRRGWLLYSAGRHDEAVLAYRAAAASAPGSIEPMVGELLPLMALRRWQDAEQRARAVLARDPNNYLALRRLALVLFNLGRFAQAEQLYKQVLVLYPADLEMLSGVGWCELKLGNKNESAAAFRSVLEVSDDATARTGLAAASAP